MKLGSVCSAARATSHIMNNILVVGGGLTSGVTSSLLAAQDQERKLNLKVWDKARGIGGRMSTSRSSNNPECQADLGAQYVTAIPKYQVEHKSHYEELIDSGLLRPIAGNSIIGRKAVDEATIDYVMPNGSSSLVKHFFQKSGLKIDLNKFIDNINMDGRKWIVTTKDGGEQEQFDCVILTMPVPQILQVAKEVLSKKRDLCKQLETVEYSSRFVLALFYDKDVSEEVFLEGGASSQYLNDNPVFRFVAIDNLKRSGKLGDPTSVILHTSVPYGIERVEQTVEEQEKELIPYFEKYFPHWPKPAQIKCHKWRYSQVSNPFPGSPGAVVICDDPLLIACGDGFTHSNFDGCVSSAIKTLDIVKEKFHL